MYVKILNEELKHHGFQYKEGLNIDVHDFDGRDPEYCTEGLYFTTYDKFPLYLTYGELIADVEVPSDAQVSYGIAKSKADRIILSNIRWIKDEKCWLNSEFCLVIVKIDGYALRFIKVQSREICLAAVKQKGSALRFVKEQTEEICLAAVKQDGYALWFVYKQFTYLFNHKGS